MRERRGEQTGDRMATVGHHTHGFSLEIEGDTQLDHRGQLARAMQARP